MNIKKSFMANTRYGIRTTLLVVAAMFLGLDPIGIVRAQTASPSTGASAAQSDNSQLLEIVVTAQRRSENMQDVPIAVTALGAEELRDAGIGSSLELVQAVPGLSFNTEIGGFGLPRIRGVGITGAGPGVENPVATYIDGVYYGTASANLFDLNDVAQVAVLKGPQGTLFGRKCYRRVDPSDHQAAISRFPCGRRGYRRRQTKRGYLAVRHRRID